VAISDSRQAVLASSLGAARVSIIAVRDMAWKCTRWRKNPVGKSAEDATRLSGATLARLR
jgi:hypothetical protein